ncbi:MAG TPA: aldehyde dehydrogenase family protein [Candidatus Acidoferrales bacterium]|nr:aldehyde dehydrogenase family protein [Candidatus Acidoferrales bacterium]
METIQKKLGTVFEPTYTLSSDGRVDFKMLIGGSWVSVPERIEVHSPIDNSLVATIPSASEKDADRAINSSYDNRSRIRTIPAVKKIEIFQHTRELLLQNAEAFITVLVLEAGKPRANAQGEIRATAERLKLTPEDYGKIRGEHIPGDWSDETIGTDADVLREPVGVVLAISPFNYPLYITATKVIPALLAGNSVIVKTSSKDPLSFLLFARLLELAGIPSTTLNVITGRGKIGEYLATSEKISMLTFTGSTEIGKTLARVAGLKTLHMELGGKGCSIVLKDADIDLAAVETVKGCLSYSGQRCDAVSRVFVQQEIADVFVKRVLKAVESYKMGDPRDSTVNFGPLIDHSSVEHVHELVTDATSKGAKLLTGGKHEGNFYQPTVLDHVPLDAKVMWEETFGPVVPIARVKDEDEAIQLANKSRFGLDSCVFTQNINLARKVAKRLEEGEVTINAAPRHGVGYYPFGGNKDSGMGREGIGYSIEEMTRLKTIVHNWKPAKVWADLVND